MKRVSLLAVVVLAACGDQVAAPGRIAPEPMPIASLVLSAPPRSGGLVTVAARLNTEALVKRAGAYSARVEFDPAVVSYVGEGSTTSGLVAFNATDGVLRVAGASLDGYDDGVLFNAKFRVANPTTTAELRLVIDELRDVSASDRLPSQTASRSALLRPWK